MSRAASLLHRAGAPIGIAMFLASLWLLHRWFAGQQLGDIASAIRALPPSALLLAAVMTCINYLWATGYDLAGMRNLGRRLAWPRVVGTAFVANALGNNLGNALVTGSAIRLWRYTRAGLSAADVGRLIVFSSTSFWLGHLLLAGLLLLAFPHALPAAWREIAGWSSRVVGAGCVFVLLLYAIAVAVHRVRPGLLPAPVRTLRLPSPTLAMLQVLLGAIDLLLMAMVFGTLVAGHGVSLTTCVVAMVAGVVAGNLSMVPGGLGVFESVVVLLVGASVPHAALAADLLVYRTVYFVGPLAAASVLALRMSAQARRERVR